MFVVRQKHKTHLNKSTFIKSLLIDGLTMLRGSGDDHIF